MSDAEQNDKNGVTIEVVYVDGRVDVHDFQLPQVTIGTDADANLSLQLMELAPKHIMLVPREKGCWVSVARDVATPVLMGGVYLDNQEVLWGAELDVGTITLRILEPSSIVKARKQSSQTLYRIIGAMLFILVVLFYLKEDVIYAPKEPATAPSLFDEGEVTCSVAPEDALEHGNEISAAASAYWQRYPFDAQEGIRATRFYKEAESCFLLVGEDERAANVGKEYAMIRKLAEKEFQTLRLQLNRALKNNDFKRGMNQVVKLANFVEHRPGEYLDWLAKVIRYLKRKRSK